ncbi:hypothetical protein [Microcoleus vaginatus]|uniref:hypothetical protein n=1 Tax=Microcoleus vaginatus TaxID=119532 RepID=UPI0032A1CCB8
MLLRKRSLTWEMIRKLNQELGIPAEILIQPYESVQIPAGVAELMYDIAIESKVDEKQ